MNQQGSIFLDKAVESLAGAESEHINRRYNNCANRAYYACFHAAVYALGVAGVGSRGALPTWSHDSLQAAFVQELIQRRKIYPAESRDTLERLHVLRIAADYRSEVISRTQAERALRRSQTFVASIRSGGGETR